MAVICRDEDMPHQSNVWRWMQDKEEVSQRIAHARELGHDAIEADCLNIADDNGKDRRILEGGREVTDADVVQRAKLRIDTRLKLLAIWNPKKYGPKVDVTTGGEKINTEVILPHVPDE